MRYAIRRIGELFDLRDMVFVCGLVMLGYGLYQIHPPTMYVVLGGLFIAMVWR